MVMKYVLSQNQIDRLEKFIQGLINSELDRIIKESDDWGLGELDELDEVQSIDKIKVNRVIAQPNMIVYIDIFTNYERYEFENVRSEINYGLSKYFPNIFVSINEVI